MDKKALLAYFRDKAEKSLEKITKEIPSKEYKERAKKVNKEVISIRESLIAEAISEAKEKKLNSHKILNDVLLITYCSYIVMIE